MLLYLFDDVLFPLFRLTSQRVCEGASPFLEIFVGSLGDLLQDFLPSTGLFSRHQRTHVFQGGIAAIPSLPLFPSLNFLVLADTP
jgi:hypothetical protein